ncbi:MAG: hypothetical protein NTV54_01640 [Ignavibacteriales bacterium]|nr:hypothetical protein [Ignavibacteriales bacterium]
MKKIFFLLVLVVLIVGPSSAQSISVDDRGEKRSLLKPMTSQEDAFGVLDKGELINILGNQGMITDSYYQNLIYNFRWPKSKGVANPNLGDVNAIDDASLMFACKGNVLDTYTMYRNEDWMAPVGARGHYHADDQPEELFAPDGAPRLAHSDIPITWPKGYFDSVSVWHSAPTGPLASLSDADKKTVLAKAAYYDPNKNVWRFWPGKFRTDVDPLSPNFGKEVPGEFAADREVYAIMTDRSAQLPSVTIGLTMEDQAYSYGRRFAEDIQFYDITITNNSGKTLDSCWFGYYIDFQFGDVLEETWGSYNSGINPKGFDNAYYQFDYNGSSPGNIEVGYFGMLVLQTPFDMGVTDGHFFRDLSGSVTPGTDSQMWPVIISDPNSKNLLATKADYFHGSNIHFDDFSLTAVGKNPGPNNWTMYVTTGPFTMQPGQKIKTTAAFSAGNDLADLKKNFLMAQKLYLNKFIGPAAPPSPKVHAVAGDRKVTLYWDDAPEKAIDPIGKVADFQGYKIYRSQDQGSTWGDKITDSRGKLVGYVPIAQFDKKDLIQGPDPMNQANYLGDNTGLVHMFVDTTVNNGVMYSYTITSYDSGSVSGELESLESARGTTAADANLADVTPRSNPIGFVDAEVTVAQIADVGNGVVAVQIADPAGLTGDPYLLTFNKSPADSFLVFNGRTKKLLTRTALASDAMVVCDGIKVRIDGDAQTGTVKSLKDNKGKNVYGDQNLSPDGKWYVKDIARNNSANTQAQGSHYEFRFTSGGSYAAGLTGQALPMVKKYTVPFEIWNTTIPEKAFQVGCILIDKNANNAFDFGDEIRVVNSPYVVRADTVGMFNLLYWYYTITVNAGTPTGARLPISGESFTIESYSQLTASDTFRVQITAPRTLRDHQLVENSLSGVRVVPNPFIVNAKWEQVSNNRRLRFMFLPPECTIAIYSVRGELITKMVHTNGTGDEDWNLTNRSGIEVAFGLYIYVVETPAGEKTIGKFSIIK